jgi:hypothetical protein
MIISILLALYEYHITNLHMDKNIKLLLQEIRDKDTKEIVEDHIRNITIDDDKKETIILIDKRYAMNILHTAEYMGHFLEAIKKCF